MDGHGRDWLTAIGLRSPCSKQQCRASFEGRERGRLLAKQMIKCAAFPLLDKIMNSRVRLNNINNIGRAKGHRLPCKKNGECALWRLRLTKRKKQTNNETKQRCYAVSIFFENVLITGDSEMANRQINEGIFKGRAC